jgi:biopolymer transport protein ExbD
MALSSAGDNNGVVAEINVTPLVDVMLVLLIIFMITAPLLAHREPIALPRARQQRNVEGPQTITVSMHADGRFYWNDVPVDRAVALRRLQLEAQRIPQPELQLRADRDTEYHTLLDLLGDAKSAGLRKIDLVTTPR